MLRFFTAMGAALTLLIAAGPAHAKWLRAESPHFVIYSDGDEKVLRGYVERLEVFHELLLLQMRPKNVGPARKLPIYLVNDRDAMQRVWGAPTDTIAGFYTAGPEDIFAAALRTRGEDYVLQHEYVHHFMLQHFPSSYPGWLVEGIAEYWMATDIQPAHVDYGTEVRLRSTWLAAPVRLPLRDVLSKGPSQMGSKDAVAVYYAKSWILTHYMMQEAGRRAQLNQYVAAVAAGGDPVASMEKATGMPVAQLDAALTSYLKGSFKSTRQGRRPKVFPTEITALPRSADDLLLESQLLKRLPDEQQDKTKAAAFVATVRKAAAKHPGDRFAELTLARAETRLGDRAKGEAILKRLLASEPDDVEALLVLARSRMAEGDGKDAAGKRVAYAEARRYLETAYKKDGERYDTLFAYVRSRSTEPQTDNDFEVLKTAYFTAPQVAPIRMQLGRVLMARKRYADAVVVIEPLANNPHGGAMVATAKTLLQEARSKAGPAAVAAR